MSETILKRDRRYAGKVVTLDLLDVRLPNGVEATREVVVHPGAVAIVAFDADGQVLLVRQYRTAADQILLELPAGTLEPDEPPEACAERELQEETGYKPGRLEHIGGIYTAPGYTTEFIHLFLAYDLVESSLPSDEDEAISVERMSFSDALDAIDAGRIEDSKTVAGLLRAARHKS
jgi:ADP-ribose pyrophosphatase